MRARASGPGILLWKGCKALRARPPAWGSRPGELDLGSWGSRPEGLGLVFIG
eukprot:CAMPEP_0184288928 /NCGR_PEP_ID=MMETSP1049-20130417/1434_1 /TAXON_ID=77928 /ORGANISM="Proteomonas sulcata, Strain CCMP704" /LENGTH=51 /DNA_ID=CAMNT_0026595539 /DNA_START=474 /DNA_END=629 /DNA_ORIENTATION=+